MLGNALRIGACLLSKIVYSLVLEHVGLGTAEHTYDSSITATSTHKFGNIY